MYKGLIANVDLTCFDLHLSRYIFDPYLHCLQIWCKSIFSSCETENSNSYFMVRMISYKSMSSREDMSIKRLVTVNVTDCPTVPVEYRAR